MILWATTTGIDLPWGGKRCAEVAFLINTVVFKDPDGKVLFTCVGHSPFNRDCCCRDRDTGQPLRDQNCVLAGHCGYVTNVKVSQGPCGAPRILTTSSDGSVIYWRTAGRYFDVLLTSPRQHYLLMGVGFTGPAQDRVFAVRSDGTLHMFFLGPQGNCKVTPLGDCLTSARGKVCFQGLEPVELATSTDQGDMLILRKGEDALQLFSVSVEGTGAVVKKCEQCVNFLGGFLEVHRHDS